MEQKFVETIKIKDGKVMGLPYHQARMAYGAQGVESIEYAPYSMREIHSLQILPSPTSPSLMARIGLHPSIHS